MIKSLTVQSFQSHELSKINLSEGLNFFIGPSDAGKSAIIRGLRWLATSRPLGKAFQSTKGGEASISVVLDNGDLVEHKIGSYSAVVDKKKQEWSAIGTGVPDTVKSLLNISDLSWQFQMDSPFLFSSNSGEVARLLNEVADLDKIDSTLVNINKMIKENKYCIADISNKEVLLLESLKEYEQVDRQISDLKKLKELEKRSFALDALVDSGTADIIAIQKLQAEIDNGLDTDLLERKLIAVREKKKAQVILDEQISIGATELMLVDSLVKEKDSIEHIVSFSDRVEKMIALARKEELIDNEVEAMKTILFAIKLIKINLSEATKQLASLEKRWKEEFPEVCPLCHKTI